MIRLKSTLLWVCLFLFVGRVVGQIYVGVYPHHPSLSLLPVWKYWYSGLLPYPWLLISQILLIQVLTLMAYDFSRGEGIFFLKSARLKLSVRCAAILYFGLMVGRFAWFDRNYFIPILFHCVLAIFLFVYSFAGERKRS